MLTAISIMKQPIVQISDGNKKIPVAKISRSRVKKFLSEESKNVTKVANVIEAGAIFC